MCQYLVVQYMEKQQKYVLVSSSRVHGDTSKYVPVSTYTEHEETSEICASI